MAARNGSRGVRVRRGRARAPARPAVLVIEPDPDLCARLAARLRERGYDTLVAYSAITGLAEARGRRPSLVLLDLDLPDLDGLALLARLKADAGTSRLGVVALCDPGDAARREAATAAGADACLPRGADGPGLVRTLAALGHGRRGRRHASGRERPWESVLAQGISRLVHASLDATRVCQAVVDGAEELLGLACASLWLLDGDELVLRVQSRSLDGAARERTRIRLGEGLVGEAARRGSALVVSDASRDDRVKNRATFAALGLRAFVAVPLRRGGRLLGVLTGAKRSRRRITAGDVQVLEALAEHAAAILDQARLLAESERRRQTAEALAALAAETSAFQATEPILGRVLEHAERLVGADLVYLALREPTADEAPIAAARGHRHPDFTRLVLAPGLGVSGLVMVEGRPVRTADYLADSRISHDLDDPIRVEGIGAVLAVPVTVGGRVAGVLWAGRRSRRPFDDEDECVLGQLAAQAAVALGNTWLHAEARAAERRFHDLVHGLDAIVWEADAETWEFTFVSRYAEALLGYPIDRWLGDGEFWVNLIHPDDRERAIEVCRTGMAEGRDSDFEYRVVAADGRVVWLRDMVRVVKDADGRVRQLRGVMVDISAQKEAVEALRRSEEQLRGAQKMEAIGRFAGGIAHDFNNILTAIAGYAELLLQRLDPPLRRDAAEIKSATERAGTLIRQILAFSRRQVLQPKVLDLNGVVTELKAMLARLIGEDIELVTVLAPDLGCVRADPAQLEQVIVNLAVNARDAMPRGGRLLIETVNVEPGESGLERSEAGHRDGYVRLAVTDTGTGMDAETKARVFEPFFTTKSVGKGTGLGLATVYGIVKQSGGYIGVESEPGRGTTFTIDLPRVRETPDARPTAATDAPARGSETILLVEDDASVRTLARRTLESAGYRVLEARDGEEALAVAGASAEPFALILTDVIMPGLRGPALVERLTGVHPDVKVLFMSGYTDTVVQSEGPLERGRNLLEKPFTPAALLRSVRHMLDAT
ncbi:MAG TPA: GAF domain-containing protein [Thermodesulfobacteriota bacterium]